MMSRALKTLAWSLSLFTPFTTFAHEVYVLPQSRVLEALSTERFSFWHTILEHAPQFTFWALVTLIVVTLVLFISKSRTLERLFDPFLAKLPPYAPFIGRAALGLSLIVGAHFHALFGPEISLSNIFGSASGAVTVILFLLGICFLFGIYTRATAFIALILFTLAVAQYGSYMLTYTTYVGEFLLIFILGAHKLGYHDKHSDRRSMPGWFLSVKETLTPYTFFILRVSFGISLLYASLYAKVIHNNLALNIAYMHPTLVQFFGFEPHFLVVGAAIIEIVLALFFILGIEIRFVSLFLLFWLCLSLWYFGESVWPHIMLMGVPLSFIFYGYDRTSLEGHFFKRKGREPVL